MKFFEFGEYWKYVFVSFAFGVFWGGIYRSLYAIYNGFVSLLLTPFDALVSANHRNIRIRKTNATSVSSNVIDFVFFTLCGAAFILIGYVFHDGVFRAFSLISAILGFLFSKRTLGSLFEKVFCLFFKYIHKILFLLFYIVLIPPKRLCALIAHIALPVVNKLLIRIEKRRVSRIVRNKEREIERFFKKIKNN